jgi:hypothetical protein
VLQKTLEAYKVWHTQLQQFPRPSRYSIGMRIDGLFTLLLETLLSASYAPPAQKIDILDNASKELDRIKLLLQAAWELKLLDHKAFARICGPVHEVGKMLGGWRKHMNEKRSGLNGA